jgi:hypothetical protein
MIGGLFGVGLSAVVVLAAGTTEVVWDDLPAVGGTVLNTTALANRAAAVLAIWKWDFRARFGSADREFAGCLDYVRLALGTGSWTAWAVSDRGPGKCPTQQFGGTKRLSHPSARRMLRAPDRLNRLQERKSLERM